MRLAGRALAALALCAITWPQELRSESVLSPVATTKLPLQCRKFDEYADLKFSEEKARLDNFAIQLQQESRAQGYYTIFGSCEGEADRHMAQAVDYLVKNNGIGRSRITATNAGCREILTVELYICPVEGGVPTPTNSATVKPCPVCKARRTGGRRRRMVRRHGEE